MNKLKSYSLWKLFGLTLILWTFSVSAQQASSQSVLDETVKLYCAAWSEPNLERRRELLKQVWSQEGSYTDPLAHAEGREALAELIGGFLQKFPRVKIVSSSHADLHHGKFRFTWKLISGDGKSISEGIDFGEIGSDGKIQNIVGFFGPINPL